MSNFARWGDRILTSGLSRASTRPYYPYDNCGQPEQKTAFSWDTIGTSRRAYVFPHQQQPQLTTNSYIVVAHYLAQPKSKEDGIKKCLLYFVALQTTQSSNIISFLYHSLDSNSIGKLNEYKPPVSLPPGENIVSQLVTSINQRTLQPTKECFHKNYKRSTTKNKSPAF